MKPTVFYVEKSHQPELHQHILKHIPRMSFWHEWHGCQLVYLPMFESNQNQSETVKDYLLHEFPILNKPEFEGVLSTLKEPSHMVVNRMMAEKHLTGDSKASLLFTNDKLQQTNDPFRVLATYHEGDTPEQFFADGFSNLYNKRFLNNPENFQNLDNEPPLRLLNKSVELDKFSKKRDASSRQFFFEPKEYETSDFDLKAYNNVDRREEIVPHLSNELKEKLSYLQQVGGNENMVDLLVHILNNMQTYIEFDSQDVVKMLESVWKDFGQSKKPSRLFINGQKRIFLTDFGNLEIEMRPLPKTLFLFFLTHPKGLRLADLVDHKEELMRIYGKITNSSDVESIRSRISDLVDMTKNSVHEKCSRVKEAFCDKMNPNMASHYIIDGERSEIKSIKLDRSLVTYEL